MSTIIFESSDSGKPVGDGPAGPKGGEFRKTPKVINPNGNKGRGAKPKYRKAPKQQDLGAATASALGNAISSQQGDIDGLKEHLEEAREIIEELTVVVPVENKPASVDIKKDVLLKALIAARQLVRHKAMVTWNSPKSESTVLSYLPVIAGCTKLGEHCPTYLDELRKMAREEILSAEPLISYWDYVMMRYRRIYSDLKQFLAVWAIETGITVSIGGLLGYFIPQLLWYGKIVKGLKTVLFLAGLGAFGPLLVKFIMSYFKPKHVKVDRLVDLCCAPYIKKTEISGTFTRTSRPVCEERTYPIGFTINHDRLFIPRSCSHNEEVALKTRQMTVPLSDSATRSVNWDIALETFKKDVRTTMNLFKHMTYEEEVGFISKLTATQKRIYASAKLEARDNIIINSDSKMFVKVEAGYTKKDLSKVNPRCISGKTPDYFLNTGPDYWLWVENVKKAKWASLNACLDQKYIYSGSLDAVTIGMIISHYESLGWYAMEGDFSRYDGHNEIEALEAEFKFYEHCGMPLTLLHYFEQQLHTRGQSRSGHKFKVTGKVASGVANTSFGNTLRNFMIAARVAIATNTIIVVIANGDDFIYFSKNRLDADLVKSVCADMGHKLECIHRDDYDLIEYCSARAWDIGGHRVMGPKPFRCLGKTFIGVNHRMTQEEVLPHIRGIAYGMRNFRWVPVLGRVLSEITEGYSGKEIPHTKNPYAIKITQEFDVDHDVLDAQFEKIYGMSPILLENELGSLDYNETGWAYTSSAVRRGLELDGCLA